MSGFSNALGVVLAINVIMFMAQVSISDVNPNADRFYDCSGTMIGEFENNGCSNSNLSTYSLDTNIASDSENYPSNPTVLDQVGNFFTDIFNSIKSWFLNDLGAKYVINVLKAPYNMLNLLGMPSEFVFILGTMWYILTFFLLIQEMRGTG